MTTRPDFVNVQLSKKGLEVAGGAPVRIASGHFEFEFKPGEPQEVTRAEWNVAIKTHTRDGEPMFEVVEEVKAAREVKAPRVGPGTPSAAATIASEGKD